MEGPYIPPHYKFNWNAFIKPSCVSEETSVSLSINDHVVFDDPTNVQAIDTLQQKLMKSIRNNDRWVIMESTDLKAGKRGGPLSIWRSQQDPKVHLAFLMEGPFMILEDPSLHLCLVVDRGGSDYIGSSDFFSSPYGEVLFPYEIPLKIESPTPDVVLLEMAHILMAKFQSKQDQAQKSKNEDQPHQILSVGHRLIPIADVQPINDQTWEQFLRDVRKDENNDEDMDDELEPFDGLKYSIDANPHRQPSGPDAWMSYATDFHQVHDDLYCRVTLGIIKEVQLHPASDCCGIWGRDGIFSFTFFRWAQPNRMVSIHGREIFHATCNVPEVTSRLLMKISLRDSTRSENRDIIIQKQCTDGAYSILFVYNDEDDDSWGGYDLKEAFEVVASFFGFKSFGGIYLAAWRNLMRPLSADARSFAINTGNRQMSEFEKAFVRNPVKINPRCIRSNIAYMGDTSNNDSEEDDDDDDDEEMGDDDDDDY
eukprot:TRINITY_DN4665_c0_g1_i1.p1 TRINITY_DN4665_c0_g1~~TRINITY_DN4665_c0_g1_i1.p1  ORF type:complete len:481 (-),score=82.40 TRINITY_DN4665_c0_g1_i1:66-1508(-)